MAAKRKKRRKASGRIFYPIYLSFVLITIAAILLMMRVLWDNMEDYEASMPKYVAQEVDTIFKYKDFATMYEYDDVSGFEEEGREAYIEYMDILTHGQEITTQEAFSPVSDEKVYKIMVGDTKLGTYTLCKSGEKTPFGNDLWKLKGIQTSVIDRNSYLITAPEGSSVYADGRLLGADEMIESGLELTSEYLPEGIERTKWCTYSVERCFSIPAFKVEDSKGRGQKLMPNENGRLTAQVNFDDDELKEAVEERVIKTARAFSQFTSDDCSTTTVMRYIKEDTNAARYIYGFDGGWFMPHRGFEYENMRTERYVRHDENTFSCNVYFDYISEYRKTTEVYPTAYTFFFEKQGDEWLLFDFTVAG